MVEKVSSQKVKIENLEEENQGYKIDLEASTIQVELLEGEKQELLAEITDTNAQNEEDVLENLSADEIKQQNRKLRQALTSLGNQIETEREKFKKQLENDESKKKMIAEYE